jgi:hypothetical protein
LCNAPIQFIVDALEDVGISDVPQFNYCNDNVIGFNTDDFLDMSEEDIIKLCNDIASAMFIAEKS